MLLPDTLYKCNLIFFTVFWNSKRSTKANCWPVNSFDCSLSALWRLRVFPLKCLPVNSFDCFPRTLWRYDCKIEKLIIEIFAKTIEFSHFSSIGQVIKQLFHMWFWNSRTVHRSIAGHNPYNLFIVTIVYSKKLTTS